MKLTRRQIILGFTLLEALLASAVLAMAIAAITMPFTASVQQQRFDARRSSAVTLAQEMMEEILSKSFSVQGEPSVPGPETGETRMTFDHFDDYDGYIEPAGQLIDSQGQPITDIAAEGLSRHVTASYVYVSGQATSGDPTFIRIVVEVKHQQDVLVRLTRLIYGGRA